LLLFQFKFQLIFQVEKVYKKPNQLKVMLFWICGIESILKKPNETKLTADLPESNIDTSIDEDKFWSNFCDVNAVIALALTGSIVAFLNKY